MRTHMQLAPAELDRMLQCYALKHDMQCRDRIIEAHLYIAEIVARKFSGRGVDYDDLYQVAAMALLKALDRFDLERGIKFASFVTPAMVGEVKNYFRDRSRTIRMPRKGTALLRQIEQAKEALQQKLHRMPRVDELAEALGVPEDEILEALETGGALNVVSLDYTPQGDDEAAPLDNYLGMEESGYNTFENIDAVRRAMALLDDRQKDIIRMRYFENMSQREVAEELGISQMTVSREERKALEAMRKQI